MRIDGNRAVVQVKAPQDAELPAAMRTMTLAEREAFVAAKAKERAEVQARIQTLAKERDAFVADKMKQSANAETLGEGIRATVREQSVKRGFAFN